MKILFLFILIFHISHVNADEIYNLIKIPNLEIYKLKNNLIELPKELVVHVHQGSIDYPRDKKGDINGLIHPERINQDWKMIKNGDPLFLDSQGIIHKYEGDQFIWPVFIGEVAYKEKKIAMSYTKKEVIRSNKLWVQEFESL